MAGFRTGPALSIWPASFVGVMLFGALLGSNGVPIPAVETAILLSLVALGLLLGLGARLPLGLGACGIGLFALFHGHAHGSEIAPGASGLAYAAGFALATALLHVTGIGLARLAARAPRPAGAMERVSGAAIAATGIVLAALG
jgi:urease accessory protein